MLDKDRLKSKLVAAFNEQSEQENADAAIDRIMDKLADAFISEIKELKITYTTGLTAGANPVIGNLEYTLS